MKLVFPNGERGQLPLDEGTYSVGAGGGNDVAIDGPGVGQTHARIEVRAGKAYLQHVDADTITTVNGKSLKGDTPMEIDDGDLIYFGQVYARVMIKDDDGKMPSDTNERPKMSDQDLGATKVRAAMPTFVLRGVSGSTFGKSFPLYGNSVVGRQDDCDIVLGAGEVSRRHARLQVVGNRVEVEDMGSANGTFINGDRVTAGRAKNGDELRFDQVRFRLQQPGMAGDDKEPPAPVEETSSNRTLIWIIGTVVVLAAVVAGLWFGGVL